MKLRGTYVRLSIPADGGSGFGSGRLRCATRGIHRGRRDPVRGDFGNCPGATSSKNYQLLEPTVINNVAEKGQNWLFVRFESYDSNVGVSFGTFEYKIQNWTKDADSRQYIFVS